MTEQFARVGDLDLCYETFGDAADEAMLLVAGFGAQMLIWDAQFCQALASEGFWVIRFDNRDAGRSTAYTDVVDVDAVMAGDYASVPYSLDDMAADAVGLLDVLKVNTAHVVGASMGGMIAQLMAINHPDRVRSLVSIMSTTGNPSVGQPTEKAAAMRLAQPEDDSEEAAIELSVKRSKTWMSPDYPRSDAQLRVSAVKRIRRSMIKGGMFRHGAAILAAPDRTYALSKLRQPTLVIHGEDDILVQPSGGAATAKAVPEAQLLTFPGMGHDLPYKLWPDFIAAIAANARRAR